MVSNNAKRMMNLASDYIGLASAVAGPVGLVFAPIFVPASIIIWGATKVTQEKLGYVANGAFNTDYADLCISRDAVAALGSLEIVGTVVSGRDYSDWKVLAADLIFPAIAAGAHFLRRRNLRELNDNGIERLAVSS